LEVGGFGAEHCEHALNAVVKQSAINLNFTQCKGIASRSLLSNSQELSRQGSCTGQGHRKCKVNLGSRVGGAHSSDVVDALVSRLANRKCQIMVAVIA